MRALSGLVALCCGLLLSFQADAQRPSSPPPEAAPTRVDTVARLTADDAATWLDGFMPYAIARGDIAGAVVTVVKDGQILVRRGYGVSDVEKQTPVDPDRTLFRMASVSKLMTWTAVMQLVEAGKLDLDADINRYLDFKVPERGLPITLRQLMTHTGGFEANLKYMWTSEAVAAAGGAELGPYLKQRVPVQIYPPGTVPAYSNYGTSLAGYIVERVSGQPFAEYVEQHIFAPLQMQHASFRQPLPPHLRRMVSQGYALGSGTPRAFEVTPSAPAGALTASGTDMARFMIAHLSAAGGADTAILKAATSAQMLTPQVRFAPPLSTMALGFYESDVNGQRVVSHAGDTLLFHSQLSLFRDHDVGLFVSLNSAGAKGITGPIRRQLLESFADRYFPKGVATSRPVVDLALASQQARALAAPSYLTSRRAETGIGLTGILSQTRLEALNGGALRLDRMKQPNGQPTTFRPIAPWVWQATDSELRLAAIVKGGEPVGFAVDSSSPYNVFVRAEGYRSARWLMPLLIAAATVLALSALAWPIAALVRRRHGRVLGWPRPALLAYRLSRAACGLLLLVPAVAMALMAWVSVDFARIDDRLDPAIIGLGVASVLAIVGGIAAMAWNLLHTVRAGRGWLARLWAVLLLASALLIGYAIFLMGLADFALNY